MTALNIVREKEVGTIEQINVTPIKKWEFIMGKLIPFWIIGMIVFTIGLMVIRVVYGIAPVGSIPLLYTVAGVYMIALLGFGLLVSTFCESQVQAMFIAFFFILIFILMSGLFTADTKHAAMGAIHIRFYTRCSFYKNRADDCS